jgi:hypothetical protein
VSEQEETMIENLFTRIWENLISRPAGPLKFRFLLQPAMAIFLAVRSGLQDSREGKSPYFWAIFADSSQRRELLRDGWKSIGKLLILTVAIDCVYQVIVLHWIYPFEALVVSLFLAIIPYLLVRGPVNRIATRRKLAARNSTAEQT